MLILLILLACQSDIGITETSVCDGELQRSEDAVDSPYDRDGDGYFDGSNPDCQDTYEVEDLDCDDLDAGVNPGAFEVDCNDIDDDCDALTLDAADEDQDGVLACDDCDDLNGRVSIATEEQCDDGIDNDCDGETDEDCAVDYSDIWFLDQSITMACAWGSVELSFSTVELTQAGSNLLIEAQGTKGQPGQTSGTLSGDSFSTNRSVPGACQEDYSFNGVFEDESNFRGSFEAAYTGGNNCADCQTQSWAIVGTR